MNFYAKPDPFYGMYIGLSNNMECKLDTIKKTHEASNLTFHKKISKDDQTDTILTELLKPGPTNIERDKNDWFNKKMARKELKIGTIFV